MTILVISQKVECRRQMRGNLSHKLYISYLVQKLFCFGLLQNGILQEDYRHSAD